MYVYCNNVEFPAKLPLSVRAYRKRFKVCFLHLLFTRVFGGGVTFRYQGGVTWIFPTSGERVLSSFRYSLLRRMYRCHFFFGGVYCNILLPFQFSGKRCATPIENNLCIFFSLPPLPFAFFQKKVTLL